MRLERQNLDRNLTMSSMPIEPTEKQTTTIQPLIEEDGEGENETTNSNLTISDITDDQGSE